MENLNMDVRRTIIFARVDTTNVITAAVKKTTCWDKLATNYPVYMHREGPDTGRWRGGCRPLDGVKNETICVLECLTKMACHLG